MYGSKAPRYFAVLDFALVERKIKHIMKIKYRCAEGLNARRDATA